MNTRLSALQTVRTCVYRIETQYPRSPRQHAAQTWAVLLFSALSTIGVVGSTLAMLALGLSASGTVVLALCACGTATAATRGIYRRTLRSSRQSDSWEALLRETLNAYPKGSARSQSNMEDLLSRPRLDLDEVKA